MAWTPHAAPLALAAGLLAAAPAAALPPPGALVARLAGGGLDRVNRHLAGRLLDFTDNHGTDRRPWAPALGDRRSLYVYLPPGYDGRTPFPAALWLHGAGQDEQSFLDIATLIDRGVRDGSIPPAVIAAPDGSLPGRGKLVRSGSFYVNSFAGRYADYILHDVWHGFVRQRFAVRPERDAHLLVGASMGGFGAFNLGFKHRTEFGHLAGIFPPLDLRYADCHGRYFGDYDPACVQALDPFPRRQVVGKFAGGLLRVRSTQLFGPLVGPDQSHTAFLAAESPVEMLARYDVRPGEFGLFIGYGTRDQFNIDAQVQHFVDVAAGRGVRADVTVVPGGKHDRATAVALFPAYGRWATARLGPFVPPGWVPPGAARACTLPASSLPAAVP